MKILLFILFINCSQLLAQSAIGISGGLNLPWQHFKTTSPSGNGEVRYKMIASFHAGVMADIPVSKKVSFQPEILVSGKGGQISGPGMNNTTAKRIIRLYYLEVPLIINYNIPINDNKIFIGSGPSLAYGISGKDKQFLDNIIALEQDAFKDFFKRFDAGIIFQAGFRSKNIRVAALCNVGVANIFNNENPNLSPGSPEVTWKNSVLGLSIAYLLSLKK